MSSSVRLSTLGVINALPVPARAPCLNRTTCGRCCSASAPRSRGRGRAPSIRARGRSPHCSVLPAPPVAASARPLSMLPGGTYAMKRVRASRLSKRSRSSGTSTMRSTERLSIRRRRGGQMPARDERSRHARGLDDREVRSQLERREVRRRGRDLGVRDVPGQRDHELRRVSLRSRRRPRSAPEVRHLLGDVRRRQAPEAGVLRPAGAIGTMTEATREDTGPPAARDHLRHRRMIAGVPIRRGEQITHLRQRERRRAVGYMPRTAVIRRRPEGGWIDDVGPRWRCFLTPQGRCASECGGRQGQHAESDESLHP